MFSKAKRFESNGIKNGPKKPEEIQNPKARLLPPSSKICGAKPKPAATPVKAPSDAQSQCSSVKSTKSFVTPKPIKPVIKAPSSLKKVVPSKTKKAPAGTTTSNPKNDDILKAQEVEIRNKDCTISEYNKEIEELKNQIAYLNKQLQETVESKKTIEVIDKQLSKISLVDGEAKSENEVNESNNQIVVQVLQNKLTQMESQCLKLEQEVSAKQVELMSLEEIIVIRDSLCKDLQEKLTNMETCLEETKQRLEMVKGHHALALEANESIRREYKAELETLKQKFEDEKQSILVKSKVDQDAIKSTYNTLIESMKINLTKEKDEIIEELQQQLHSKDIEIQAKLEQIDEATHEKLRLCEIQFEERSKTIQDHWNQQQNQIQYLEKEAKELQHKVRISEDLNKSLQNEVNAMKNEVDFLKQEKLNLNKESEDLQEEFKKKRIDFENEINKLTVEVDQAIQEKNKFQMSLSVTRDIVHVLSMRLRESDNDLEHMEQKMQTLTSSKEALEDEVVTYKNTLNKTVKECEEYKEALVNILKSKAALAKEHTRIMEHNVSLIESLQNVEKEAYRELGSIKNELIEDVEMIKKESTCQIKVLRDEVEKKRILCELATEHAGQATAAAEQARALLAQAANEIARLESENQLLQQQIQDQQSLVVELSLLRQENEELAVTVAKQSSTLDKMKKDAELILVKPKSPSVMRKTHKAGKENMQVVVSPLRERNH